MFKKLKDKITEEVKSSPQRFQQLTQSVSDRLQSTQAPSEDNFFTIDEEDANTSQSPTDQGFSSVALVSPTDNKHRRNSNSSIASDISFLPRYESSNMYHLQSDLDASASEFEDNISTSSVMGHTKEQIYSAFQKSQMRYHKYRGRYTDLARHYKDLERENSKMKSVLVETQDKAIRRVTELKEQCALEQKAKAHLESALRDEIDEQKIKISTLKTKINLLQSGNNVENSDVLVEVNNKSDDLVSSERLENLTKYLNEARSEIELLNSKIQEYKANTIIFQTKEQDYKSKIVNFEKQIAQFDEREKENNLILAQNKMELHNELLSRDTEISRLKKELETIQEKYESNLRPNTKLDNLQSQNNKLIEKVENLTLKCNNLEAELLKIETYKLKIRELTAKNEELQSFRDDETTKLKTLKHGLQNCQEIIQKLSKEKEEMARSIENQKIEYENQISNLRESAKKGLFSLENQIQQKISEDFLIKEEKLKEEFKHKLEEISTNNTTSKEAHLQLIEKQNMLNKTTKDLEEVTTKLQTKEEQYKTLELDQIKLIEDGNILRNTVANLEKDLANAYGSSEDQKTYEARIERLQSSIKTLQEENINLNGLSERKEHENITLEKEILKLENTNKDLYQKLRLLEEKDEITKLDLNECNLLEMKLQKLEEEKRSLVNSFEEERMVFNEVIRKNEALKFKEEEMQELQERNDNLLSKVTSLKWFLTIKENKIVQLAKTKQKLEEEMKKLKESVRIFEEKDQAVELDKTECSLLKIRVQKLEEERENLLKSFEKERKVYERQISLHSEDGSTMCKEEEDIKNSLIKENLILKEINEDLTEKVRLFEEKDIAIDLENTESKLLELKVQKAEEEKKKLVEEFEMEREMFNKLLEENNDLKLKEEKIIELEDNIKSMEEKIINLKGYLEDKESEIVRLNKVKLTLEQELTKIKENVRILEEREETSALAETEYNMLKMKVQSLEQEMDGLVKAFELERKSFEDTYSKNAHNLDKIENLMKGNMELKAEKDHINSKLKEESEKNLRQTEEISTLNKDLKILNDSVDSLKKELEDRDQRIVEMLTRISELNECLEKQSLEFNQVLEKSKLLEVDLENAVKQKAELHRKEEVLTQEVNDLRRIVESKDLEIKEICIKLNSVEANCNSERDNFIKQVSEVETLQKRVFELENAEGNLRLALNEKIELEEELNELKIEQEQRNTEFAKQLKEVEILQQRILELEEARANVGLLQDEKKILEEEIVKFKDLQDNYHSENQNLHKQLEEIEVLQKRIVDLEDVENNLKQIQNKKQLVENKLQSIESEKKTLEEKLLESNKELTKKTEEYKFKIKEFGVLEQQLALVRSEKENLKSEVIDLRQKLSDLTQESSQLQIFASQSKEAGQNLVVLQKKNEALQIECNRLNEEISELKVRVNQLSLDNRNVNEENTSLLNSLEEHKVKNEFLESEKLEFEAIKNKLELEKQGFENMIEELKNSSENNDDLAKIQRDFYEIKEKCDNLHLENKNIKSDCTKLEEQCSEFSTIKKNLEAQISDLEHQYNDLLHEKQLLQEEIQEFKIAPVQNRTKLDDLQLLKTDSNTTTNNTISDTEKSSYVNEIEQLRDKVTKYKSLDLTNKSSIEFYENELHKLKVTNEKLNRRLDDTLVTLHHCAELSDSTEIEYLKNVLYNYMLGKESMVLARVIAAVCKFDPEQTEAVLQKEQQKQTLSTYCTAIQQYGVDTKREIDVVNLDPAAEHFDYEPLIDIRELIHVQDTMEDEELHFGPNGGLVFCIEYLLENSDWLHERLGEHEDDYILFDCPGQIELYTHLTAVKKLVKLLQNWNFNVCCVFLVDVQFMTDGAKFLSGTMAALSVMVNLELPHVNILSKMDLLGKSARKRLDRFLEPDSHAILGDIELSGNTAFNEKHRKLTEAIGKIIEDYSLVRFIPLNLKNHESIGDILITIDNVIQFGEDQDVKTKDFEEEPDND